MNKTKGFTIIELIVVIAIIAILAAVVMVSVTQYIKKSKEAALFAELKQIPLIATKHIEETGSFSGFYANSNLSDIHDAIGKINSEYTLLEVDEGGWLDYAGDPQPLANSALSGKWVAYVTNVTFDYFYCIDSSGYIGKDMTQPIDSCAQQ